MNVEKYLNAEKVEDIMDREVLVKMLKEEFLPKIADFYKHMEAVGNGEEKFAMVVIDFLKVIGKEEFTDRDFILAYWFLKDFLQRVDLSVSMTLQTVIDALKKENEKLNTELLECEKKIKSMKDNCICKEGFENE